MDLYLNDRAAKGFTVIQGVLALWDYNGRRNPDGQLPFNNGDLGRINEAYYKNVDSILDKAAARGLYMAILPFWVKNSGNMLAGGDNPEKMKAYCKFLARRYASRNIFWILGGDATAAGAAGANVQHVTDLEAEGLLEGAKAAGVDKILISYHPTGRQSSSFWFQARPWLDFNCIQSGHFIRTTNFRLVGDDFAKTPAKPTLDMEPGYENITDGLVRDNPNAPRIAAGDVRRSAYLAVFAGSAGHTYGNGEVYEFWSTNEGRAMPGWGASLDWRESLKLPGSGQMQFLRYLIESRPMLIRIRPNLDRRAGQRERHRAGRGDARQRRQLRVHLHSHRQAFHRGFDKAVGPKAAGLVVRPAHRGGGVVWRMAAGRVARVHAALQRGREGLGAGAGRFVARICLATPSFFTLINVIDGAGRFVPRFCPARQAVGKTQEKNALARRRRTGE